jgi:hypothetical protein
VSTFAFAPPDIPVVLTEGGDITIDDGVLEVRFGAPTLFAASVPLSSIASAEHLDDLTNRTRGVHGSFGRWLVNHSSTGIVKLRLRPAARAELTLSADTLIGGSGPAATVVRWMARDRVIRLRELTLSVASPEEFIASLRPA